MKFWILAQIGRPRKRPAPRSASPAKRMPRRR